MTLRSRSGRAASAPATLVILAILAILIMLVAPAVAATHLKRGDLPPSFTLDSLDGERVSLADRRGHPIVLVFGELYHDKTLEACGEIGRALKSDALASHAITMLLVVAQRAPVEDLRARATDPRLPALILHDADRGVYADYRVAVMPSVVIIDAKGRVVHAVAGHSARFADIVTDALHVAAGELSFEQFEKMLHPTADAADETMIRASRITSLARQLARRGLGRLAEEKYQEALAIAPDYPPARIGFAMILLEMDRLSAAEREFRTALAVNPASLEAALGLAYVQTLRGGAELDAARQSIRDLLRDHPSEPRAHYLLGIIQQNRDEKDDAIASFRKSTELLMNRRETWTVIPERRGEP